MTACDNIKKPDVRGSFYPFDERDIAVFMDPGMVETAFSCGAVFGLIVPHAGYRYSAKYALPAYLAAAKNMAYRRIFVLAPSHYFSFEGAALPEWDGFDGIFAVLRTDKKAIDSLSEKRPFFISNDKFNKEHAIETQLPFLARFLPDIPIVPIIIGTLGEGDSEELVTALSLYAGDSLFIASSDLSHYKTKARANVMDKALIDAVISMDRRFFLDEYRRGKIECCGFFPIYILMGIAGNMGSSGAQIVSFGDSSSVTGDRDRVVGYASIVFTGEEIKMMLSVKEKTMLLKLARDTIAFYLKNGKKYDPPDEIKNTFTGKSGAFTTLRKKDGELRGCIGFIVAEKPLWETVRDTAIESAFGDPRFYPLKQSEFASITIEISILTIPERVASADGIVMGRDGVIVRRGWNQGVFLPQVATETGWDRTTFLRHLCADKAGLSPDAWKEKDTELLTFRAIVFSEDEVEQ